MPCLALLPLLLCALAHLLQEGFIPRQEKCKKGKTWIEAVPCDDFKGVYNESVLHVKKKKYLLTFGT